MNDILITPTNGDEIEGLEVTSNIVCPSIINSVTNDEDDDDRIESKRSNGCMIVNSVTNDEDIWIEPRNNNQDSRETTRHISDNYRSAFSKQECAIDQFDQHKSAILPSFPVSLPDNRHSMDDLFDKRSYLTRYECMMNEQEKEQTSTISHLKCFFEVLIEIRNNGNDGVDRLQRFDGSKDNYLLTEFSIEDLKKANKKIKESKKYDTIKTDKQFLMALDILCEDEDTSVVVWAEIVQIYRICVVGMQTLEIIGHNSTIRNRTKERTLALLRYTESSHANYTPRAHGPRGSYDMKDVNATRVDKESLNKRKSRGPLNHPVVLLIVGFTVVTILIHGLNPGWGRQNMTSSMEVNESINSLGEEFRVSKKISENSLSDKYISGSIEALRDQLIYEKWR